MKFVSTLEFFLPNWVFGDNKINEHVIFMQFSIGNLINMWITQESSNWMLGIFINIMKLNCACDEC